MRDLSGKYKLEDVESPKEFLHLDIDGPDPLKMASGTISRGEYSTHWIAKLTETDDNKIWAGQIWYREGSISGFLYDQIKIKIELDHVTTIFIIGSITSDEKKYIKIADSFRRIDINYAREKGVRAIREIDTHIHPFHHPNIDGENLTIEDVFFRTGLKVSSNKNLEEVDSKWMSDDEVWSNRELHDAMQAHWDRFSNDPAWALWVFFGRKHECGKRIGGIMFDEIGPRHRQGTAIFNESFIGELPDGVEVPTGMTLDEHKKKWVERMKFFTACHEIGHALNLAHANEKNKGNPWIALENEIDLRSFMNNPIDVKPARFFREFEYKFSQSELIFLRHAPEQFVQMGHAKWAHNHGLEFHEADHGADHNAHFDFKISTGAQNGIFEFLEPVMIELELKNLSKCTKEVPQFLLSDDKNVEVYVRKRNVWKKRISFARYFSSEATRNLEPYFGKEEDILRESMFVSASLNEWLITDPGQYTIQARLNFNGHELYSNPLKIRVLRPESYDEQRLAYDIFTTDVARVLEFDGSRFLTKSNYYLEEMADQMKGRKAAIHAQIALSIPKTKLFKEIDGITGEIKDNQPDIELAREVLTNILVTNEVASCRTLGYTDFHHYKKILESL